MRFQQQFTNAKTNTDMYLTKPQVTEALKLISSEKTPMENLLELRKVSVFSKISLDKVEWLMREKARRFNLEAYGEEERTEITPTPLSEEEKASTSSAISKVMEMLGKGPNTLWDTKVFNRLLAPNKEHCRKMLREFLFTKGQEYTKSYEESLEQKKMLKPKVFMLTNGRSYVENAVRVELWNLLSQTMLLTREKGFCEGLRDYWETIRSTPREIATLQSLLSSTWDLTTSKLNAYLKKHGHIPKGTLCETVHCNDDAHDIFFTKWRLSCLGWMLAMPTDTHEACTLSQHDENEIKAEYDAIFLRGESTNQ